jgi:NAD(P)H dehydrogenase (quinone)
MNHLIISAHPSEKSFSNYVASNLVSKSIENGWEVIWHDLYKSGFNPVLSPSDLQLLKDGVTPMDIKTEQQKIASAEIISVIYPLWWASFPGILKGYIDRVLSNGFAFQYGKGGASGLLTEKKVILHTTMGNTVEEYQEKGLIEAFKRSQGDEVFGFCGMDVVGHYFYPQITLADEAQRDLFLSKALKVYQQFWPVAEVKNIAV